MTWFHNKASYKQSMNEIKGLYDNQDIWVEYKDQITGMISKYFSYLFSSSHPSESDILNDTNRELSKKFDAEEIPVALSQIHPIKLQGRMVSRETSIRSFGILWEMRLRNAV